MSETEASPQAARPLLLIDVDGVISLFGFPARQPPKGTWMMLDGTPHLISAAGGPLLRELGGAFELVWCTGWEDRANDILPQLLGIPGPLPVISFDQTPSAGKAHWKLAAIDSFCGPTRPVAWIDDRLDARCEAWEATRREGGGPTLLVRTEPEVGITPEKAASMMRWVESVRPEPDEFPAPAPRSTAASG